MPAKRKRKYNKYGQYGKSKRKADASRKAKPPGKRVSKSGNVYTERRANRSDAGRKRGSYRKGNYL